MPNFKSDIVTGTGCFYSSDFYKDNWVALKRLKSQVGRNAAIVATLMSYELDEDV